jgi:hypothetical protein
MKKLISLHVLLLIFCAAGFSQYVLKTPDGKTVKLNKNGTWEYVGNDDKKKMEATVIPASSSAKYTSKLKKFAVLYNPGVWKLDTAIKQPEVWWEATFYSNDAAITAFCFESRLSYPAKKIEAEFREQYEALGEIKSFKVKTDTLDNYEKSTVELELMSNDVLYLYKGYVFSSPKGSFQFIAGTQKEIFTEDYNKIMELLNGVVKL